jgi:biopolymer transport protein ExbD
MKFPRNARIFRGQLDAAPLAAVFALLLIFLLLGSLVYTPGVRIELPVADELPGVEGPAIRVAVDRHGQFYFSNQVVSRNQLRARLHQAVRESAEPVTLVVQADKAVTQEVLIDLATLSSKAGIRTLLLATLPRPFAPVVAAPVR